MAGSNPSSTEIIKLLGVTKVLSDAMGAGVSLERVRLFMVIAKHCVVDGEADQNEVARELDLLIPTAARNVAALTDIGDRGREALGLVDVSFGLKDRRRRVLRLTTKGEQLIRKLSGQVSK